MQSKSVRVQGIILFFLILANFIAQIPYDFHLYHNLNNVLARGGLMMLSGFLVFLLASLLLFKRTVPGYWLMLVFLAAEFLFYLWNVVGAIMHGYGLFFQLNNPDLLLRVVFAIGYINLFASGYFLGLLLFKRAAFLNSQERPLTRAAW